MVDLIGDIYLILRKWQSEIINKYDEIRNTHKKFILKAPTGAGKTVLASEIIKKFYSNKKILVLCHRIVLLEQLERELKIDHKVRKLGISDDIKHFGFIAQDVEKEFPSLVSTDNEGMKSINYLEMIPLLLHKINDLERKIDELKNNN